MLTRYGHTAIIAMDAAALRRVRGKTRVLLTRFLARALLCPIFSQEWAERPQKGGIIQLRVVQAQCWPSVRSHLSLQSEIKLGYAPCLFVPSDIVPLRCATCVAHSDKLPYVSCALVQSGKVCQSWTWRGPRQLQRP